MVMKNVKLQIQKIPCLVLFVLLGCLTAYAQSGITVRGTVVDSKGEVIIGASVAVKGNKTVGTITDLDGNFKLIVPNDKAVLVVSFIGMTPQEVKVAGRTTIKVTLVDDNIQLEEVVVVGYGQQKKASIVGSITQTTGKVLERAGGVTNVGAALTGNLPGVITYNSTGMPGAEDPKIIIRTQSSWNNSDPLVLVDGIERSMSTVDVSSVEHISVLKDASATAVYGVKGANGVILITTKRGKEGKANVQVKANMTAKTVSKLPEKYDAYDSFLLRNQAIERELPLTAGGWTDYKPLGIIDKYRNPANAEEWDRYPNVDWEDILFRDAALSYNTSVNVSGGSSLVNYFVAVDFIHEGDLFKNFENKRGYTSGYGYNRINVRSNLDFNITKTTKFSVNLFGSNGQRTLPWDAKDSDAVYWNAAYKTAPDAMRPIYSNGMWGYYAPRDADVPNSMCALATSGVEKRTTNEINTDFVFNQKLDMITKGLNFKASFSMDYRFKEKKRGIYDGSAAQRMWVDPDTGEIKYALQTNAGTQLDPTDNISWKSQAGEVDMNATYRKLYYLFQLDYARTFGQHEVSLMGVFNREKNATGSSFPHYREDWVFRTTYNYAMKYFFEANGAYNGSEKFGPEHRFAFFPSFSLGWMLSEEKFMKKIKFIDMLKFRASWGQIGDDNVTSNYLFQDQLSYGGNTLLGEIPSKTPYNYYRITSLGNPNVSWETVEKRNLGIDYSFFDGLIAGSVDIFNDSRRDILIAGDKRAVPSYFGMTPAYANLGKVDSHGYELELRLNYVFNNGIRLWANTNMTHAVNKVKFRDDPVLTPDYLRQAGYAIGQTKSYIDSGFLQSWDDVYGSTELGTNNNNKLPGDFNIIDFNADGVIDSNDRAPYQYSSIPQNTYNATVGFEWKGFSCFVQFYGVNNVTREVTFPTFQNASSVAYVEGSYWNKNGSGAIPYPRWTTKTDESASGTRYQFDGSYVRLKNAEISYSFQNNWVKKLGMKSCRLYLNGDNLLLWTKMPDDRESNFSGGSGSGAYPTVRRFNLGIDITL
ncbi:SusC/RagA family TonB-linked outer membrane protein [Bacteroides difficilis]|uniref:TonB-dependent receptor n=1 Tax=Bacteroides difficilis TaxID=2763021 RepID=A0ABR7CBP1_9BACE|nr:TonB-dependent receptor [Bacteroides difficilis]MBC5605211.1 TonB-dependent receptor [Bacteroides difficilis]